MKQSDYGFRSISLRLVVFDKNWFLLLFLGFRLEVQILRLFSILRDHQFGLLLQFLLFHLVQNIDILVLLVDGTQILMDTQQNVEVLFFLRIIWLLDSWQTQICILNAILSSNHQRCVHFLVLADFLDSGAIENKTEIIFFINFWGFHHKTEVLIIFIDFGAVEDKAEILFIINFWGVHHIAKVLIIFINFGAAEDKTEIWIVFLYFRVVKSKTEVLIAAFFFLCWTIQYKTEVLIADFFFVGWTIE